MPIPNKYKIIVENSIGRKLRKGEVIHHINRNRNDNRLCNLVLCKNQSEHMIIHNKEFGNNFSYKKHTKLSKIKMSNSQRRLYKEGYKNPFLGKKHSKESIKKMSESQKKWRVGRKLVAWNKGIKNKEHSKFMKGNQNARKYAK